MDNSYAVLADVRRRELKTRVLVAAMVAAAAFAITPTWGPPAWLAAVVTSQLLDTINTRAMRGAATRGAQAVWMITVFCNSVIYSSLGVYLWVDGSETGRLLGVLLVSGSLLHVTIHMHHVRGMLLAAIIPHAAILLAMPLYSVTRGEPIMWTIVMAGMLYLGHLVVTFRQADTTTRQIQAERERAEEASKAKSDFLATVSHEIRTPMNAIVSAANLLGRSKLNKAQREQVEMLKDANDVLLSLLNDVLDLSRIEAGKMAIEPTPMDLARTLEGLHRLWSPRAADKGLDLRLELADGIPERVVLDPLRLKQILSNLISNAVKFTEAGAVTVRLGVDGATAPPRLVMEVVDTGVGIPPEALSRLFGAFEQAGAGATRKHGGSGLGLAISRRLAAMMEGNLDVESAPGRGSTFRLTLPLVEACAETSPAEAEGDAEMGDDVLGGVSILVAEDHPVNRRVVELLLGPLGCELTFCEDGAQAVEAAALRPFDAILMDMQMPVLDGVEATRRIKSGRGPNAGAPVVALTANALDHHRAEWATVGVHAFVSKPIDPRELVVALTEARRAARGRRAA